jgi:uncharacterized lipoprotein YmbA
VKMKKDVSITLAASALCTLLIIIGGCGRTQTARFYTLNALTDPPTERQAAPAARSVAVGLGPIRLPEYLDRPQIVTRISPNEVRFAEYHRWAGPLAGDLSSTLAENLSILLGTDRIALYPWKATTPIDCRVEIEVSRFDGKPGDSVVLESQWIVFSGDRRRVLGTSTSSLREPVNGKGCEALVAAQSRALAALGREIAEAIRSLPRDMSEE